MAEHNDGVERERIEPVLPTPAMTDEAIKLEGNEGLKLQGAALQIRLTRLNQDLHKIATTLRQMASRRP
jgi:hypothetical protein